MTTSKNRKRKQERAEYHAIMREFKRNPRSTEALGMLAGLKEEYFRQVDGELSGLFSDLAEKTFVNTIIQTIDHGDGWVTIYRAGGDEVKLRSNLWDYIRSRRMRDPNSARAAESLVERVVISIRPRRKMAERMS